MVSQPGMRLQYRGSHRSWWKDLSNLQPAKNLVLWGASICPALPATALGWPKQAPEQEEVADSHFLACQMRLGSRNLAETAAPP
jgi:hypothetical protein